MENPIEIIIAGDICPTKDTEPLFESGQEHPIFNNVLPLLKQADCTVANLECAVLNQGKAIKKSGPALKANESTIKVLKKAGFNVLSLANNHIKDFGAAGVINTINTCNKYTIETFGAGSNLTVAKKPFIKEIKGIKIGFLAFAEQEFNIASATEAGANFLDVYEDFDSIRSLKNKVDYLIVVYHGGVEYHPYPSPLLQKKCRKLIASGADLVTCQHSHCIGTTEQYQNGTIVYGQGNTLFGYRKNNSGWNEGLLLKVTIHKQESLHASLTFVPVQTLPNGSINVMDTPLKEQRLATFFKQSQQCADANFIAAAWQSFCAHKSVLYIPWLLGFNTFCIRLNRLLGNRIVKLLYTKKRLRTALNIVRCEAHNEVIQTILENKTNNE